MWLDTPREPAALLRFTQAMFMPMADRYCGFANIALTVLAGWLL
jgi:hypothetical protein